MKPTQTLDSIFHERAMGLHLFTIHCGIKHRAFNCKFNVSIFQDVCVCVVSSCILGPLYSKIDTISKKDVKYSLVYTDIIAEETQVFIYHWP